ncbi:DUF2218 domain-containing protein [Roseicella sp. DB1501]|uniref:DUF2218 domain-containing protein n=1 Tax=Roseicella sp. DB1501 TaxID=2730925 RepID=UPI001490AC37|nr:DUF2218 domain-containing protein [Roseicella sp. DB1501]NOG70644.1 DUF2218 domain-containing protein [Roseicella sp. DB1501]
MPAPQSQGAQDQGAPNQEASAEARVPTAMAGRYLTQLCKHFGHRVPTGIEDGRGWIAFQGGGCTLETDGDSLVMRIAAEDAASLARLEEVAASHLQRFAFRETLQIAWQPVG